MPALSYVETNGNGSNATFSFASLDLFLDIPKKDQINVYVNGQIQTYTTHYTVSGTNVVFESGFIPANGVTVKIARETKIDDRLVNFTNSSILTAADLNKNTDQLLFLAQELDDTVTNIALTTAGGIADGAITAEKLSQVSGEEAVVTNAIRDGAVQAAKLATDAVTTNNILNLAVTTGKLADLAVTYAKQGFVTTGTWTPVPAGYLDPPSNTWNLIPMTSPGSISSGFWVKIDKWVFAVGRVAVTSIGALGTARKYFIEAPTLPNPDPAATAFSWPVNLAYQNGWLQNATRSRPDSGYFLRATLDTARNYITLTGFRTDGPLQVVTLADMNIPSSASADIIFNFFYKTA